MSAEPPVSRGPRRRRSAATAALLLLLLALPAGAHAAVKVTADPCMTATAVNDGGLTVGISQSGGVARGTLLKAGTCVTLPPLPGYASSAAVDINDAGVIVGESVTADETKRRATKWTVAAPGSPVDLGALGTDGASASTEAQAVNASGAIVGTGYSGTGLDTQTAVRFGPNGGATALSGGDNAPGLDDLGRILVNDRNAATSAFDGTSLSDLLPVGHPVSPTGTVVGQRGSTSKAGAWRPPGYAATTLGQLPGQTTSAALAVDADGEAVGTATVGGAPVGVEWSPAGAATNLNAKATLPSGASIASGLDVSPDGSFVLVRTAAGEQYVLGQPDLVVNDAGDAPDATTDDGLCRTAAGKCTLRAAITQANADPGEDTVAFAIPGSGVPTIKAGGALPAAATGQPVTIDGTTQPAGAVHVDGGGTAAGDGLTLRGSSSVLEGVSVSGFKGAGVAVQGAGGVKLLRGAISSNGGDGVRFGDSSNATVGGNVAKDALTITGNGGDGVAVTSGRGVAVGPTTLVYGNAGLPIDLGPQGAVNHTGGTVSGAPNDALSAPVVWHIQPGIGFGDTVMGIIPNAPPKATLRIDVQGNACAPRAAGAAEVLAPTTVKTDSDGTARFQLTGIAGGQTADVRATLLSGDVPVETSEASACAHDADADEIPDEWETAKADPYRNGADLLDLKSMGASPRHRDLFLEVGWAPGHAIDPAATKRIEDAFAKAPYDNPDGRRGIALHIDDGPDSVMDPRTGRHWGRLAEGRSADADAKGLVDHSDWSKVDALRRTLLPKARTPAFRFAFSNAHVTPGDNNTDGEAEHIPGSELVLGLSADCKTAVCPVSLDKQTGVLMHEFGHLLGLHHGGFDDVLYKPNQLSIMNYVFTTTGLVTVQHGQATPGLFDYSRFGDKDLGVLDENKLQEARGVGARTAAVRNFMTAWHCPRGSRDEIGVGRVGHAFDWNCNGKLDRRPIAVDLTGDSPGDDPKPTKGILTPYDEWGLIDPIGGDMLDPKPSAFRLRAREATAAAAAGEKWPSPAKLLSYARVLVRDRKAPSLKLKVKTRRKGKTRTLVITVKASDNRRLDSVALRVDKRTPLTLRRKKANRTYAKTLRVKVTRGRHTVTARAVDWIGQASKLRRARVRVR